MEIALEQRPDSGDKASPVDEPAKKIIAETEQLNRLGQRAGHLKPGLPAASATIWQWDNPSTADHTQAATRLRKKGLVQAMIGLGIATLILFWLPIIAIIGYTVSVITLVAALLSPLVVYKRLLDLINRLGFVIGTVLSWITLPFFFYSFFLPFRLLFRRGKHDTMERQWSAEVSSYWIDRSADAPSNLGSYERQF